jgi:hypothetical protein
MEPLEGKMTKSPNLDLVSTKRRRIAELARQAPAMAFMSLAHHIDINFLHAAYAMTRKDGAVGLDGQTAAEYAVGLEANLASLLDRFKSGQYKAPPVCVIARPLQVRTIQGSACASCPHPKRGWPEDSADRNPDV